MSGSFEVLTSLPATIPVGGALDIQVRFTAGASGTLSRGLLISSNADGSPHGVRLTGNVDDPTLPRLSVSEAVLSVVAAPGVALSAASLGFEDTETGAGRARTLTVTNNGTQPLVISAITVAAPFSWTGPALPATLQPEAAATVTVDFEPSAVGQASGVLSITSNAPESPHGVAITGTGVAPGTAPAFKRLSASGNQIVDSDGVPVRLRSVNWFGAEGSNNTPHGTWMVSYQHILDQISAAGFNCVRLPFHGGFGNTGLPVPGTAYDATANPDFVGKTAYEILDLIIAYCGQKGLRVVLDHHRREAGAGADGSPVGGSYQVQNWIATWQVMAGRYGANPVVCGADLHNEPHDLDWDSWAAYAEQCGNAIHQVAPHWLLMVEGVGAYQGQSYWWGGALGGVRNRPVNFSVPNKCVYSPHTYGISVGHQNWLRSDSNPTVPNYPANLYEVWRQNWGFIFEESRGPIWIGEMGGHFGRDPNTTGPSGSISATNAQYETQWMTELVKYLNGDLNGDGNRDIAVDKLGMSFAWWSWNPNSGDTGGLVGNDWTTLQTVKLNILNPALTA